MIVRLCYWFANWLTALGRFELIKRGWKDREDYLDRFYFLHSGRVRPGVYLHHFLADDDDDEVHDHPWWLSFSIILSGGYVEERFFQRSGSRGVLVRRAFRPGSVNVIFGSTFHRVEKVRPETWTLFISFFKRRSWGFYNLKTNVFLDWETHRAWKKAGSPPFFNDPYLPAIESRVNRIQARGKPGLPPEVK